MTRAKKATPTKSKRDDRIVTYVRLKPEEHAQIAQIANQRGYPHTIASVTSEMVSKGLKTEAAPPQIYKLPETGEISLTHDVVVDADDLQRFIDAGGTIYKRGYRIELVKAPANEVVS